MNKYKIGIILQNKIDWQDEIIQCDGYIISSDFVNFYNESKVSGYMGVPDRDCIQSYPKLITIIKKL